jgi:hypothetical protein
LPFSPAWNQRVGFPYVQAGGQFLEIRLKSGSDHQTEVMDFWMPIKPTPSMGNHRKAGHLEEQFVNPRPHPGSTTGGHDDGGVHVKKARPWPRL